MAATHQFLWFSYRTPRPFNITRFLVYVSVVCFTIICLGVAAYLANVLANSDLTRFVPFTLFVCCASLAIFATLLGFSALGTRNPINTKIELACLAAAALIWLVLAVFLSTSPSQSADVECFSDSASSLVLDESVAALRTDAYHAMYRVIMAFSLINASIVLAASLLLAFLVVRSFRGGNEHYLMSPVTTISWFTPAKPSKGNLTRGASRHSRKHSTSRRHNSRRSPRHPYGVYRTETRQHRGSGDTALVRPMYDDDLEALHQGKIHNPNRLPA